MPTNDETQVGDTVETPYGRGRVIEVTPSGLTVWVAGRGNYRIPRKQQPAANHPFLARLRELAATKPVKAATADGAAQGSSSPTNLQEARVRAMAAMDALRLGTVPRFALREATIGRDGEIARVARALEATKRTRAGRTIVVTGPNGAGKTHMLPLIEEEALERGYVIARAELEGALKIAPKMAYQKLVTNLVWLRDGERHEGTLEDFLNDNDDDLDRVRLDQLAECPLMKQLILDLRDANTIPDAVWDWVHGDEVFAQALTKSGYKAGWLKADGTHGQTVSNPMSGLARISQDLGYSGLTILLDEAELVLLQDARWAVIGREWLRGLVLAAQGGTFHSASGDFVEGETPEFVTWSVWGGKTLLQPVTEYRLRYGGVDPARFSNIADRNCLRHAPAGAVPLVLVLGYTDQNDSPQNVFDEQDELSETWLPQAAAEEDWLELPEMRRDDVEELIHRLVALYATAYPSEAPRIRATMPDVTPMLARELSHHLERGSIESIRGVGQAIVDILDRIATGYPAERLRRILEAGA